MDFSDDLGDVERRIHRRLQINAQQMRRGLARVTVLVEFDAGQHQHFVPAPRALPLALDHRKIFRHLFLPERAIGQLGQLAQQAARVRQMVGDADAIKTVFAVKIHNLRHAQLAVGIV